MPSRVKSLELNGFKTFASTTFFGFSENVTAIVGPNGSGKSNIADCLRWVLGEQSFSLMRAKKTEDMIFSGSESRPRVGMASATITFDNNDGWLPIEFNEVAITRRAFRNGENEYLINGQRVRLKDLVELLAQSGLSERTYTVIGQGLVDAALSLKAEERRRLFEEAAGIGLFRIRRMETIRRLDITLRNLERVQDILSELRPRLKSLERQARKSKEYEQLTEDLRAYLREWYGYQWHKLQGELSQASTTAQAQEARLEEARIEQESNEKKVVDHRNRTQRIRADLNDWHRELANLHAQRENVSREVAVIEERIRLLAEQQMNAKSELPFIDQEVDFLTEQTQLATREVGNLLGETREAESKLASSQQQLEARINEKEIAQRSLDEIQGKISSLVSRQVQIEALTLERKSRVERNNKLIKDSEKSLMEVEDELKENNGHLLSSHESADEAAKLSKSVEKKLSEVQENLISVEDELKQVLGEHDNLSAESARISARLSVLEQAEFSLTGYASGTRILLEAARSNQLKGILGSLNTHIEVPTHLEVAITAALGEFLEAILVGDDPEPILEKLESESARSTLLPLKSIRPLEEARPKDLERDGVIGIASDLLACPPEYQRIIDLLLGRVLIVEDRKIAKSIIQSQSVGLRVVTLHGEVYHATGPIQTYGSQATHTKGTLLGRSQNIQELSKNLKNNEQQISTLEEQKSMLEEQRSDLSIMQESLSKENKQKYRSWQDELALVRQAELSVQQSQKMVQWHSEQRDRFLEESKEDEEEIDRLSKELLQIEQELDQARESLHKAKKKVEVLTLDDYQADVSHWNTLKAVAERALKDARAIEHDRIETLNKSHEKRDATNLRLKELGSTIRNLEEQKIHNNKALKEKGAQIDALHEKISPAENDLKSLEMELSSLEKVEASSRMRLSTAEHLFAQTRINYDRKQEAVEVLRQRIEDDFGLVSYRYDEQVTGQSPLPFEGFVEELPVVDTLPRGIEANIQRMRMQLRRLGAINFEAQTEFQDVKTRFDFLTEQLADLEKAEQDLRQVIHELDVMMRREFSSTFQDVSAEFRKTFTRLFGGGAAHLELTDPDDLTNSGIDIVARLPGRRTQGLAMLSGGERSLTASALIFSLIRVSPTPFCVLDEVDAMLDEVNVARFREMLRELSQMTQFVIITHNRHTIQAADVIYGVTMGRDSTSQVLSLKLDEIGQVVD